MIIFENPLFEAELYQAIADGSLPDIVKILRIMAAGGAAIPSEIVLKICDYLDPDRPAIKSGPKSNSNRWRNFCMVQDYLCLCANKELARYVVHCGKIGLPIFTGEDAFSKAKEPYYQRFKFPSNGQIEDLICERYGVIENRMFQNIRSEEKKRLAKLEEKKSKAGLPQ